MTAVTVGVPRTAAPVDAVVHGLDVRHPLRRRHAISQSAFTPAADFCARTRWPASLLLGCSVRARIKGLRLVLTGRPVGPQEPSGPGSEGLRRRL